MVDRGHTATEDIVERLGEVLKGANVLIGTAEACTGGGVSVALTSGVNSLEWFDRGFVAYSDEAKRKMLAVKATSLKKHGAVSRVVAEEMAKGVIKKSKATLAVAVSGLVEPDGGSDETPVGSVWIAWAVNDRVDSTKMHFPGDRSAICRGAIALALQGLLVRAIELKEKNKKIELEVGEAENVVQ